MSKAIVHLDEIKFTWEEMKKIPDDHVAALAVLSYAVSETNALSKIYLCQSHDYIGEKAVDSASNIHRFLVIRNWSSKLFEIVEFLRFGGKKPETTDKKLRKLSTQALLRFEEISNNEGYEVAKAIRHEATNHYSFEAAKKNLESVHNSADCTMYLSKQSGNCFYPLGEEVMFHARLNRRWRNVKTKKEKDDLFNQWLAWNLAANSWLAETHAKFSDELLFRVTGKNEATPKKYWVSKAFVSRNTERLTPIFFERPEK